jgi:hypothetical protein
MTTLRGPGVKSVGKPDAGNRHVRFDERGRETGLLVPRPSSTLPTPPPDKDRQPLKVGAKRARELSRNRLKFEGPDAAV